MSQLLKKLRDGEFVVTAEITPPVSTDPAEFLSARCRSRAWSTAINVTDGAGAKVHLSSLVAAHFLVQAGIEPIFQMTCRDRNRLALQGDLLGAAALGIHNILVLAGDDPKLGDQPEAKAVFDLNSRDLLAMAARMRRGTQAAHRRRKSRERCDLVLGAADVPVDPPADWNPKGLLGKAEAGADFVQTQFCMDAGVVRRYAARLLELGFKLPILIGVAPIPSARSARWMREKLFGTLIPDAIVERLEKAADPKDEGAKICVELLQELAEIPGIAGAHVMAPHELLRRSRASSQIRASPARSRRRGLQRRASSS